MAQTVAPGGAAHYRLRVYPPDLPHTVTLTATSSSPVLEVALAPPVVGPETTVTLTVTDFHTGSGGLPGLWHTIPITGVGDGFTQVVEVRLLVGGARIYLPAVLKVSELR
jgi:hypothetical protein